MILIIGGYAQGKLQYAVERYQASDWKVAEGYLTCGKGKDNHESFSSVGQTDVGTKKRTGTG